MVTPEGLASSQTQLQLHELHSKQRAHGPSLQRHLDWLCSVDGFAGVSDHDLLFTRQAAVPEGGGSGADDGRSIINEMEGERRGPHEIPTWERRIGMLGAGLWPLGLWDWGIICPHL